MCILQSDSNLPMSSFLSFCSYLNYLVLASPYVHAPSVGSIQFSKQGRFLLIIGKSSFSIFFKKKTSASRSRMGLLHI